jgi:drug/metabolite transporter (DMT)-like permease
LAVTVSTAPPFVVRTPRPDPSAIGSKDDLTSMALTGEGLALLSGFSFAAASVAVAKGDRRGGGDNGAILSIVVTAIAAALVWIAIADGRTVHLGPEGWKGLVWYGVSGLLTIVFGRALLFRSIERLGAVRASAVKRLNPFFSVLLAVLVLGEAMSPLQAVGTGLMALSFAMLIHDAVGASAARAASNARPATLGAYAFGPASALCYAVGYLARKAGLEYVPDPNFGTLIGAVAGLASYLVLALFREHSRKVLAGLFTNVTRWKFAAAVFVSVGQLAQFGAIHFIEISRVVMITSLEIFIAMILSVYVTRTEKRPDLPTIMAAVMATAGGVLVTLS